MTGDCCVLKIPASKCEQKTFDASKKTNLNNNFYSLLKSPRNIDLAYFIGHFAVFLKSQKDLFSDLKFCLKSKSVYTLLTNVCIMTNDTFGD